MDAMSLSTIIDIFLVLFIHIMPSRIFYAFLIAWIRRNTGYSFFRVVFLLEVINITVRYIARRRGPPPENVSPTGSPAAPLRKKRRGGRRGRDRSLLQDERTFGTDSWTYHRNKDGFGLMLH